MTSSVGSSKLVSLQFIETVQKYILSIKLHTRNTDIKFSLLINMYTIASMTRNKFLVVSIFN